MEPFNEINYLSESQWNTGSPKCALPPCPAPFIILQDPANYGRRTYKFRTARQSAFKRNYVLLKVSHLQLF